MAAAVDALRHGFHNSSNEIILYINTGIAEQVVKVKMVKMYKLGVEIERRMLNDRYTTTHEGQLVIMDVTDQGRHRPIKVARLMTERGVACELLDVHVVWSSDNRITFTGDERIRNDAGQAVSYKQSWLCTLDYTTAQDESSIEPIRRIKPPPR